MIGLADDFCQFDTSSILCDVSVSKTMSANILVFSMTILQHIMRFIQNQSYCIRLDLSRSSVNHRYQPRENYDL